MKIFTRTWQVLMIVFLSSSLVFAQSSKLLTKENLVKEYQMIEDGAKFIPENAYINWQSQETTTKSFKAALTEDFESGVFPPGSWTTTVTNADYSWKSYTTIPITGSYSMDCEYDPDLIPVQDEWFISPVMDLSSYIQPQVTFMINTSYTWSVDPYDNYDVNLMVTTDGGTTWTEYWDEHDVTGGFADYTPFEVIVDLPVHLTTQIAFQYAGSDGAQAIIDDISVDEAPDCANPTDETVSNITTTGADLGWTSVDSFFDVFVEISGTGTNPNTDIFTITANDVANPYTWSGGVANTYYDWWVRADCDAGGGDGQSEWVGPFTFKTMNAGDCIWSICLEDSWGDGWDFASVDVFVGGVLVYDDLTLAAGTGPECSEFAVSDCDIVDVVYTSGYYPSENSYSIYDNTSTLVITDPGIPTGVTVAGYCTPPTCPAPGDLSVVNQTILGADLGWTENGTATAWDLEIGTTGFTPSGTATDPGVTTNPFTWAGGAPSSSYDFYVRAVCGPGDESCWIGPYTFTTSSAGDCFWEICLEDNFGDGWNGGSVDVLVDGNLVFDDITIVSGGGPECYTFGVFECSTIEVEYTAGSYPGENEFYIYDHNSVLIASATGTFDPFTVTTPAYCGTCPFPSALSATNITATGADLGWTEMGTATIWDVEIGTAGFTPTETPTDNNVANPFIWAGGVAETDYEFYVRAECGLGDYSCWNGPFLFTTAPTCLVPTDGTSSNETVGGADLEWTSIDSFFDVFIEISTGGTTPDDLTTPTIDDNDGVSLTWEDGDPNTEYIWWVRADCNQDNIDVSDWAGPYTFNTKCESVSDFIEPFDLVTTPDLPDCWAKVGTDGSANTWTTYVSSAPNSLYLYGSGVQPVVALPPVNNAGAGTHWLKFQARPNYSVIGNDVEVGYLTDPADETTFTPVVTVSITGDAFAEYTAVLGTAPGANTVLALRHTGSPGNSLAIDDVVWELAPACLAPTDPMVSAITTLGADLGWTSAESFFDVFVEVAGTGTDPNVTPVSLTADDVANPYTYDGGVADETYDWWVRTDCAADGGSGQSDWVQGDPFTTACTPFTGFSFVEDFEGLTWLPDCWSKNLPGGDASNDILQNSDQNHTDPGTYSARFSSYSSATDYNQYLFSPPMTIDALYTHLSFWHRKYSTSGDILEWGIATTNDPADFTWTAVTLSDTEWKETTVDLTTYVGQTVYIGFHYYGNYLYYVYLDDVVVDMPPACPDPTDPTVSALTPSGADLGWTSVDSFFDIYIGESGVVTAPDEFSTPVYEDQANPFTYADGAEATTYDWWVRADCEADGGTGTSDWVQGPSFTTPCEPLTAIPYFEGFETAFAPDCWLNDSWDWSLYGGEFNGDEWAYSNTAGSMLTSPGFTLADDYIFEFWYRAEGASYPQDMDVLLSTDGVNFTTTLFQVIGETSTTYLYKEIDLSAYNGQTIYIQFNGLTGTGGFSWGICVDDFYIGKPRIQTDLTVFLEGPYDTLSVMNTALLTGFGGTPYLPTAQPYNKTAGYYGNPEDPKWKYTGTESITPPWPADVVDWVVVQLRDAVDGVNAGPGTVPTNGTRAAFLLSDGSIVDLDGSSPVLFYDVSIVNNLYVVVYHRNHLGIMSANAVTQTAGLYTYDYSTGIDQVYPGNGTGLGHEDLDGTGVWGMISSDGDGNGVIELSDSQGPWADDLGFSGYWGGDFDMNGVGEITDKQEFWEDNLGLGSQAGKGSVEVNKSMIPE